MSAPTEFLPFRYHLEVYPDSFGNDPMHSAQSKSPFPAHSKGDLIDLRGLDNNQMNSANGRIVDVCHIHWTIENSHVAHKLMIAVEAAELN